MVGIDLPVYPVRGQIPGTETSPETLGAVDGYVAQKSLGEVIIGNTTEDSGFDPGVTSGALQSLATGAIRVVPTFEKALLQRTSAGFRAGTPDEMPILGPVKVLEGYDNAFGHFRTEILNTPLRGVVLARIADRRASFDPD